MGMTREQFGILVKGMKAVYTSERFIPDQNSFNVWYQLLGDLDYNMVNIAIQKYMLTEKFPPTIADIRGMAADTFSPVLDWGEGWEEVGRAIRRYGMYREQEALDSMTEITRRVVRRLGFKSLCTSENETADRSNFRQIFEQEAKRSKEDSLMPERIREMITTTAERLRIEG